MIIGTPESIPGQVARNSHGGQGEYFVRTLFSDVPGATFNYVRDLTLYPGSSIGSHPHHGEEEIYFVIAGRGIMTVGTEEREIGPGSVVLTQSGSWHGLRNGGTEDLRIFVACAACR